MPSLKRDLFSGQGFLVAAFNCRGAGRSGGRSGASAQTETEDYESVVASLISMANRASVPISKLLHLRASSWHPLSDFRDTVLHLTSKTHSSVWFIHCLPCRSTDP